MDLGKDDTLDPEMVPPSPYFASLSDPALDRYDLRQEPYECNPSRTDLCGGPPERAVPTATGDSDRGQAFISHQRDLV